MTKRVFSRDGPASFKIPATKPGAIKALCSMPDYLEIFTPHETFKVQTPDTIDPERTNPDVLWVNAKTHDVGSSSPFVARTIITAHETLSTSNLVSKSESEEIMLCIHNIKELLLQCDATRNGYLQSLASEDAKLSASGYELAEGSPALAYFPVVHELNTKVTTFLIAARRLVTEICALPSLIIKSVSLHARLDYLVEKELKPQLGDKHPLVTTLSGFLLGVGRIVDLRNGQEHSRTTKARKLIINNYQLMPSNQIRKPTWHLEGEEPVDIETELNSIAEFLLRFSEATFIGSIFSILPSWPPYEFQKVESPDPECPVEYRLTIDASKLNLK